MILLLCGLLAQTNQQGHLFRIAGYVFLNFLGCWEKIITLQQKHKCNYQALQHGRVVYQQFSYNSGCIRLHIKIYSVVSQKNVLETSANTTVSTNTVQKCNPKPAHDHQPMNNPRDMRKTGKLVHFVLCPLKILGLTSGYKPPSGTAWAPDRRVYIKTLFPPVQSHIS